MLFDRGIVAPGVDGGYVDSDTAFGGKAFPGTIRQYKPRHPALPEGEPQRRALCQREQPLQ